MTDPIEAAESARPNRPTAGAKLREAREAAGWSIGDVAAQLKLAPRQVAALEEDDWARLPGRTFIRGFARNYARFLALDPDTVLALLPPPEHAPALERPSFAAARRPMGEIPVERAAKPSAARWLLPLLLVVACAYGFYEYTRQKAIGDRDAPPAAASAPAAARNPAGTPAAPASTAATLPNPLADVAPAAPESAPERGNAVPAAASDAAPAAAPAPSPPPASPAATATDATLILAFKGASWAEVRDANGRVILQMTGGAGMTQTVNGTPPFELALGNAPGVAVTFRGRALDLAQYTRGSVARVSLR